MAPKTRAGKRAAPPPSSRTRAQTSAQPSASTPPARPPPLSMHDLPWPLRTREQQVRFQALSKREIIPSRFFDAVALQYLGLFDEVNRYLSTIGWTRFGTFRFSTYTELTLEFLSSFACELRDTDPDHVGYVIFRLMGVDYRLTMAEFDAIFGFPNAGTRFVLDFNLYDAVGTWARFVGNNQFPYSPRTSKSTHLRSHSLRYIHRVLSSSIFGRGESTGVVNKNELFMLWAMTNGVPVDTGYWVCRHLLDVATASRGAIVVGGLITAIAVHFGFSITESRLVPVPGKILVDISTCLSMRLCTRVGTAFCLLDRDGNRIPRDGGGDGDEGGVGGDAGAGSSYAHEAGPSRTAGVGTSSGAVPMDDEPAFSYPLPDFDPGAPSSDSATLQLLMEQMRLNTESISQLNQTFTTFHDSLTRQYRTLSHRFTMLENRVEAAFNLPSSESDSESTAGD